MDNGDFRKVVGRRIKALRKKRSLTQKELGAELGISFGQLNKYESGYNSPPLELLATMAAKLGVSVDYLVTGRELDLPVANTRLLGRLKAFEQFGSEDQEAVMRLLDAMILKNKVEGVLEAQRDSLTVDG